MDQDVVAMALTEPGCAEQGAGAVIFGYGHVSTASILQLERQAS
jgi:hypothetical protein